MNALWRKAGVWWDGSPYVSWGISICALFGVAFTAFCPQSPGISIGLLGLAAGIMSIRPKMHSAEKFAWVLILTSYAVLEFAAIKRSDEHNQAERAAQNAKFQAIVTELRMGYVENQSQFRTTIEGVERVFSKTREAADTATMAVNQVTGGDSFAYVDFLGGPAQFVDVYKVGKAPLYEVWISFLNCYVDVEDLGNYSNSPRHVGCMAAASIGLKSLGDFPVGSSPPLAPVTGFQMKDALSPGFRVVETHGYIFLKSTFNARNGSWEQYSWLRFVKGDSLRTVDRWEHAIRVYKRIYDAKAIPRRGKLLFERIPSDFPKYVIEENMTRY